MSGIPGAVQSQVSVQIGKQEAQTQDAQASNFTGAQVNQAYDENKVDVKVDISEESDLTDQEKESSKKDVDHLETENRLEEQTLADIDNSESSYNYIEIFNSVVNGDLGGFQKLKPSERIRFLVDLYKDQEPNSEPILKLVLPFCSASEINTSFRFYSLEKLSNNNKKIYLLARVAGEDTEPADDATIRLLLNSTPEIISGSEKRTLFNLRKKEHLGDAFYKAAMKRTMGRVTPQDMATLYKLSAKIATTCFAYYEDPLNKIVEMAIDTKGSIFENNLKKVEGLTFQDRKALIDSFIKQQIIEQKSQRINKLLNKVRAKKAAQKGLKNTVARTSANPEMAKQQIQRRIDAFVQ